MAFHDLLKNISWNALCHSLKGEDKMIRDWKRNYAPVRFFIHYLLRSGKRIEFPLYGAHLIRYEEISEEWQLSTSNEKLLKPGIYVGVHGASTRHYDNPYYAVGKFLVVVGVNSNIGKQVIVYLDKYEFYHWCGTYNHFNGCGCNMESDEWDSSVTVFSEPEWLYDLRYRILMFLKRHKIISERIFYRHLPHRKIFSVKDKVFAKCGKPFWSTLEVKRPFRYTSVVY